MAILEVNIADLRLDPQRFQFKLAHGATGSTGSLVGVRKWNENLSGIVLVWGDPRDNEDYVVNGHNRVVLAKQLGIKRILCRYLECRDAREARMIGALANLAEGSCTALDAAKFLRDSGASIDYLKDFGINIRLKLVQDGLKISNLDDLLFLHAVCGRLSIEKAAILGRLPKDRQSEVWEIIKDKDISATALEEVVENILNPASVDLLSLLGQASQQEEELIKSEIAGLVREKLRRSRKLLQQVSNSCNSDFLEGIGNNLNRGNNRNTSELVGQILGIFDQLKGLNSPISQILADGVRLVKSGKSVEEAATRCVNALIKIIPAMLQSAA